MKNETQRFLQAYVVTMDNGVVYLARVMAASFEEGEQMAREIPESLDATATVWASCAFPVGDKQQEQGPGWDILRSYDTAGQ